MTAKEMEEQYAALKNKRGLYIFIVGALLILPVIGYVFDGMLLEGVSWPTAEEWAYLPLNFGTYGILGITTVFIFLVILTSIVVMVRSIGETGFSLVGIIVSIALTIIVYGIAMSIYFGAISWVYEAIGTDFEFVFLGIHVSGSQPIPGDSETLGMALVNSLFYDMPLIFCAVRAVVLHKKCKALEPHGKTEETRKQEI